MAELAGRGPPAGGGDSIAVDLGRRRWVAARWALSWRSRATPAGSEPSCRSRSSRAGQGSRGSPAGERAYASTSATPPGSSLVAVDGRPRRRHRRRVDPGEAAPSASITATGRGARRRSKCTGAGLGGRADRQESDLALRPGARPGLGRRNRPAGRRTCSRRLFPARSGRLGSAARWRAQTEHRGPRRPARAGELSIRGPDRRPCASGLAAGADDRPTSAGSRAAGHPDAGDALRRRRSRSPVPISPRLLRNQLEYQGIQSAWSRGWPFGDPPLREVEVDGAVGCARAHPGNRPGGRLLQRRRRLLVDADQPPGDHRPDLHARDRPAARRAPPGRARRQVEARLREVAEELGLLLSRGRDQPAAADRPADPLGGVLRLRPGAVALFLGPRSSGS